MALDEVSNTDVYRHCKRGLEQTGASVDAIYINGGGWDAAPAVELLERDLNVKVVLAMAAEMWLTYHKLAIQLSVPDCGMLLRDGYSPG